MNSDTLSRLQILQAPQRFGENVGGLIIYADVIDLHFAFFDALLYVVISGINVVAYERDDFFTTMILICHLKVYVILSPSTHVTTR